MDNQHKSIHAFKDDALGTHDAVALAQLIAAKKISVQEIAQASVERALAVNPTLNAIECEYFEQLLQSPTFQSNQFFSGVPIFIKDNLDLAGYPTQQGSTSFISDIKKKNSKITQQILNGGFLAMGKSKMPEFGFNAATEFKDGHCTRNPWNLDYSCGASSGGSAALVASGVVPIAHANDGGGSIRIPAANCGLVGLKPTRRRLMANEASEFLPVDLISDGVVTRSVRDTAYFFSEMEKQFQSKKLPPIGLVTQPIEKKLKIAVVYDSLQTSADVETKAVVQHTARLLEQAGHHIEEISLPVPDNFVDDFSQYWGFLAFSVHRFGKLMFGKSFDATELDHLSMGLSQLYQKNMLKTPLFIYRLKQIQRIYSQVFKQYDVVLSPVLTHATPEVGYLSPTQPFDELFEKLRQYVAFTPIQNIAGAPAISLPMGFTQQHRRPLGVMISADYGQEKILLELAYQLEQIQPFVKLSDENR